MRWRKTGWQSQDECGCQEVSLQGTFPTLCTFQSQGQMIRTVYFWTSLLWPQLLTKVLMHAWHILAGAREDIRGMHSQTALSKHCGGKASETSPGSFTHPTRDQQGGGQCFKVELVHHKIWRSHTTGLFFPLLFIILSVISPLCCLFFFFALHFLYFTSLYLHFQVILPHRHNLWASTLM